MNNQGKSTIPRNLQTITSTEFPRSLSQAVKPVNPVKPKMILLRTKNLQLKIFQCIIVLLYALHTAVNRKTSITNRITIRSSHRRRCLPGGDMFGIPLQSPTTTPHRPLRIRKLDLNCFLLLFASTTLLYSFQTYIILSFKAKVNKLSR